jgi:hypothetical protein
LNYNVIGIIAEILGSVQNEKKVVVGSQSGVLNLWTWGDWGDSSDRVLGHPSSIDTICKLDEDTVCTGSSDGIIRVVSILPNKFEGVIGAHGEDFPIERLQLSYDNAWLGSCAHDNSIRFWDVRFLFNEEDETASVASDSGKESSESDGAFQHKSDSDGGGDGDGSNSGSDSDSDDADSYRFSDRDDSDEAERAPRRKRRMTHKSNGNFFEGL